MIKCRARNLLGVTLLELIVVLAILGTLGAVAATAYPPRRVLTDRETVLDRVAQLRDSAIVTHAARRATVALDGKVYSVLALPDGSVLTDSAVRMDRYSGRPQ